MTRALMLALSILFVLPLMLAGCAPSPTDPDKSVVLVHVYKNHAKSYISGTGFVVADGGYIITNYHVIKRHLKFNGYRITVYPEGEKATPYPVSVIWSSRYLDLAILRSRTLNSPAFVINSSQLDKGANVKAIGFPGVANVIDSNHVASTISSHTRGVVSRVVRSDWLGLGVSVQAIQHTASINPGNSGGPLINICGQVVGVNTLTTTKGQNTFFSSHASELARILREQNIPATITNSPCHVSTGGISVFWVIILSLFISIIISATAMYFLSTKMKHVVDGATNFILTPKSRNGPHNQTEVLYTIPSSKFYLQNKSNKQIYGLDPHNLSRQPLIISRLSRPDTIHIDEANISAQHARLSCSLSEPWKFYLEDLGSRNGTRLNGTSLIANETPREISPGDMVQFGAVQFDFLYSGNLQKKPEHVAKIDEWILQGSDPSTGQTIAIELSFERFKTQNYQLVIGRNSEFCHEVINDPTISSRGHAKIIFIGNQFKIHDMGSTNGTKINGRAIAPGPEHLTTLSKNMIIHLGSFELHVIQK